jgi:hypothetical protein
MLFRFVSGRPLKYDNIARAARRQNKSARRGVDSGQRPKGPAKPNEFDSQPSAMRFIGESRSKCTRKERGSRNVSGPGFPQRSREFE